MSKKIVIKNEDCFKTIDQLKKLDKKIVDVILTSPPYNTDRPFTSEKCMENYEGKYDVHLDTMTQEQYIEWTINLFKGFDDILKKNGVILYNLSYGNDNKSYMKKSIGLMWLVVAAIIKDTDFTIADRIIWKKNSALPNNVSHNKLTRIVEDVFVICRKSELITFNCNKQVKTISEKTGQKFYENIFNFITAKNNDGKCPYNKATYSSELCMQLLSIYASKDSLVYDPFMGSGTTAYACKQMGLPCIGSEISENQCKFAEERLAELD